jgi:DNA-binding IclR family transcriptional regulator
MKTIKRVVSIMSFLQETVQPATLTEIAQATDLNKATAYRYLTDLVTVQYLQRDDNSRYYVQNGQRRIRYEYTNPESTNPLTTRHSSLKRSKRR